MNDVVHLLLKISVTLVVLFIIFSFVYGVQKVKDVSMKPAIRDGDLVLYYRLDKNLVAGDTVILENDGKTLLTRVVAVAGDTVDINKDGLYINGLQQISQDIYFDTTQFKNGITFPLKVKQNQVFVLGDNRPKALDSRILGCIDLKDVHGKVIMVIRTRGI